MKLLESRVKWNAATKAQKLKVAKKVHKDLLSDSFDFIGLETFEAGGEKNTVGVFTHKKTEMTFHLLPGEEHYFPGAGEHYNTIRTHYKMDMDERFVGSIMIRPFLISRYLVTGKAWNKFNGKPLFFEVGNDDAIDGVDKGDVMKWGANIGLRLPTEMEWEYACKAGTTSIFYWGNEPDLNRAWTRENTQSSKEYSQLKEEKMDANGFGIKGMIGNMAEWVLYDLKDENHESGILKGGWKQYDWGFNRSTSRIDCGSGDIGCSARIVFDLFAENA